MNTKPKIPGYWNMNDNKVAFMSQAELYEWLNYSAEEQAEIAALWQRNAELDEELRLANLVLGSKN